MVETMIMPQGSKSESDNRPRCVGVDERNRCTMRVTRVRDSGTGVSVQMLQVIQIIECITGGQRDENEVRRGHRQPVGVQHESRAVQESRVRVGGLN